MEQGTMNACNENENEKGNEKEKEKENKGESVEFKCKNVMKTEILIMVCSFGI